MKLAPLFQALLIALALGSQPAQAGETQTVNLSVPEGDKLIVTLPADWKQKVRQPEPDIPPTIKIDSASGGLSLLITFVPDLKQTFTTKEGVDTLVTTVDKQYVAGSVEKKTTLVQLESKTGHGAYATYTDADLVGVASPPAGQFHFVTGGLFVIGKQAAAFTLLCNDLKSPEFNEALKVISEGVVTQ